MPNKQLKPRAENANMSSDLMDCGASKGELCPPLKMFYSLFDFCLCCCPFWVMDILHPKKWMEVDDYTLRRGQNPLVNYTCLRWCVSKSCCDSACSNILCCIPANCDRTFLCCVGGSVLQCSPRYVMKGQTGMHLFLVVDKDKEDSSTIKREPYPERCVP